MFVVFKLSCDDVVDAVVVSSLLLELEVDKVEEVVSSFEFTTVSVDGVVEEVAATPGRRCRNNGATPPLFFFRVGVSKADGIITPSVEGETCCGLVLLLLLLQVD